MAGVNQMNSNNQIKISDFVSLSKSEITNLVDINIEKWCDSGDDTLAMLSLITKVELYATECKQKLAKRVVEEVAKYGKEGVSKNGVKFSLFSSVRYDYSNSPAYVAKKAEIEPLSEELKDIEKIAKATKQKTTWVSSQGEEYDIFPAIQSGSETTKSSIQ